MSRELRERADILMRELNEMLVPISEEIRRQKILEEIKISNSLREERFL